MNTGTEAVKSGGFHIGIGYKGVDGQTYRFVGDKGNGKGLFMVGRDYVLKSYDDMTLRKVGLFEEGGIDISAMDMLDFRHFVGEQAFVAMTPAERVEGAKKYVMETLGKLKGSLKFRDGGDIAEGNTDMLHSQVQEIKHHAMELSKLVHKGMDVEAWVVVKAQRAATDLSDITHYLDGEENKFEHGGNIPEENVSMLHNQVKNIKHHAMELSELVHKGMEVEPWVIGKAQRVASDLSDITHYLDGESDKFEHGGYMADGGEVGSFEKKVKDAMKVTIDDFKFTFETNEDLAKAESTGYVPDYDIVRIEVDLGDGNTVDFPVKTREQYANELETRGDKIMNAYQDKMYFDINEYATDEDNEEYEEEYAKGGNVRKRTGLNLIKVDDQMKKITRGRIVNVKLPNEVKAFKTKVVDVYDDFVTTARGIFSKKYIFEDGGSVPQKKYDDTVARTILAQLGGSGRLTAMTGAYQFTNVQGRGLAFKIKNARANYIKIMLNSMDLYDVEIGRIRGGQYKIVKEGLGLYADQLKRFIENGTGMRLSLAKGGDVKRNRYADGGQLDPVVFDVFIMMPEDEMMGMEEEPDVYEASSMQYKKGGVSLKHKK